MKKKTEVKQSEQETSAASHTPTPWHRNVSPAWKYPIYADKSGNPNGKDWIHIAAVLSGNPNAEADLDFIVRAVNAHEALLRELKSALFYIHTYGGDVTKNFECGGNIEQINKAIALAEGATEGNQGKEE
jgi:hypothetical protein